VIVVVCLNPALDVTHHVDAVDWGGVNRPRAVRARPGGKGLNVARTLHALGVDVLVLGLAGGITGAGVEAALRERCVPGRAHPGRRGDPAHLQRRRRPQGHRVLRARPDRRRGGVRRVPPRVRAGAEESHRGGAVRQPAAGAGGRDLRHADRDRGRGGRARGADTHGEALRRGAAAGPAIVKPNLTELAALAGPAARSALAPPADGAADRATAAAAAGQLRGAQAVVVTLGPDGLLAVTGDGCWRARAPAAVAGNATGAGDAVAAALAHGLVLGRPWDERLRHAAALGAATAAAPVAGEFRRQDYLGALTAVTVEEVR